MTFLLIAVFGVYILEQMPLTGVGKMFKPALRWDAIRRVYQNELKALDNTVRSIEVTVAEDKVHGSLARISIQAAADVSAHEIEKRVRDILSRYTVKYHIDVTH